MSNRFRRVALYATVARYVVGGVAWWIQRHQTHQLCERCNAAVSHRPERQQGLASVFTLADECHALVSALAGTPKNSEMHRRILELLATDKPVTVTVVDPKRGD